jgi:iron(III) transport system substrate-binding protein
VIYFYWHLKENIIKGILGDFAEPCLKSFSLINTTTGGYGNMLSLSIKKRWLIILLGLLLGVFLILSGCSQNNETMKPREVVIYTSVDQVFAETILKEFEQQSKIKVKAVYDVEAAKTTGLVNRLIAEKDKPQADVFWSSEFVQTILLQEKGVLDTYKPAAAADIPSSFKEKDGYWTAFGGRARVFLVNTEKVAAADYPASLQDMNSDKWTAERIGMPYPMFGTTATHAAALYAYMGEAEARSYFQNLQKRGIRIVEGNSVVRDMVVSGELDWGITDTDDADGAVKSGAKVGIIYPDQSDMGTLIVPNTVALIKGSKNSDAAREIIEYLVSKEVEQKLTDVGFIQIPCRELDSMPAGLPESGVKGMTIDFTAVYKAQESAKQDMAEIFIR